MSVQPSVWLCGAATAAAAAELAKLWPNGSNRETDKGHLSRTVTSLCTDLLCTAEPLQISIPQKTKTVMFNFPRSEPGNVLENQTCAFPETLC